MLEVGKYLDNIREKNPVVHHITNYVTVRDCANITLAVGASPIMSDEILDAQEIVLLASAFVINLGTMRESTFQSALATGKVANERGIPIVFDPVGVGASKYRNNCAERFLQELNISVVKGNISEISFLAGETFKSSGVDASKEDEKRDITEVRNIAKKLSEKCNSIVVVTGKSDLVVNGEKCYIVENGHPWLKNITGAGCMMASLLGSFIGANLLNIEVVTAAVALMGVCGEEAYKLNKDRGAASFGLSLIDQVSLMKGETFKLKVKVKKL